MSDTLSMSEFRALFGKNPVRSTTEGYYEWKIINNPYRYGKIYLEYKDNIIVGSTTITPKKISIFNEEILAAEIGDTFTHPLYRRQGIFSRGVNACTNFAVSSGVKLIYGTPNLESLPGYEKNLGYAQCRFIHLRYLIKHLRFLPIIKTYAANYFSRRNEKPLKFSYAEQHKNFPPDFKQSLNILTVNNIEDEIDGLWGNPRYIFFTVRDKTYLNWRYSMNPDEYQILLAKGKGDYWGYLVLKLSQDGKRGIICDYITFNDQMDVFHMLIKRAEQIFKEAGVDFIQVQCAFCSPYYHTLANYAYHDQGATYQQPIIIYSKSDCGKTLLSTDARWHFTASDADNI